jgi:hypothetical protein
MREAALMSKEIEKKDLESLMVRIERNLYLRLKWFSAISKIPMGKIIEKLIEDHIEKR